MISVTRLLLKGHYAYTLELCIINMASAKKKRTHAEKDEVAEEVEDNVSVESEDGDTDESENEFRDQVYYQHPLKLLLFKL